MRSEIGVLGLYEERDAILQFVESQAGVEAYVEPKTVMHPLSVVLVVGDGEHGASSSPTMPTSARWHGSMT
ncbi:MAG: hypothetical protein M3O88_06555 [Actinomycetota bacterium]|nr:hypothetical protein [Actinomycetota bacterium]